MSYVYLAREFYFVPWLPVVQGWTLPDYLRCVDMYAAAGVDLRDVPVVGLGSVCRRQATSEIGELVTCFAERGLRLHGFGVKSAGWRLYGHLLASADSMAWWRQHLGDNGVAHEALHQLVERLARPLLRRRQDLQPLAPQPQGPDRR